ncbi:MAG: V-type ATP synthase subunit I [Bullifex sp.]
MDLFTEKMKMVTALVLKSRSEAVVRALVSEGVTDFVHLSDYDEESAEVLTDHAPEVPALVLSELRSRAEALLRSASLPLPSLRDADLSGSGHPDVDEAKRLLDRLSGALTAVREEQKTVSQRQAAVKEIQSYLKDGKREYLDLRVGKITPKAAEELGVSLLPINGIVFPSAGYTAVLTLSRDASRLSKILDAAGFVSCEDPEAADKAWEDSHAGTAARVKQLEDENDALREKGRSRIMRKKDELEALYISLATGEICSNAESYLSQTRDTCVITGWVPSLKSEEVEATIRNAAGESCVIEWTEDCEVGRERVPVAMKSSRGLAPFERLVKNYSTPEYGSVNPTPFTAVTYMLMFALMFADLGQGFVLLMIGLIGKYLYKKDPMKKDGLISRGLCDLLIYLGPASMAGGIVFGSTFGYSIFPALWFNYHQVVNGHATGAFSSVYDILGITIKFGIAVIFLGLILNWINLFRKKRWIELVFDKNGLVGGAMYAVGIIACFGFVESGYKTISLSPWMVALLALCLFLLIAKGPLSAMLNAAKGHKESIGQVIIDTVMDFLVEVLEIFSGFLSNTLSFMRVAGLGIAHVSLMTAFEQMAGMTGNIAAEIVIMILGNVLVIAIEGLSAGIQSLRLNYYEFYTKYFTGHGIAYQPIGLDGKIRIDR